MKQNKKPSKTRITAVLSSALIITAACLTLPALFSGNGSQSEDQIGRTASEGINPASFEVVDRLSSLNADLGLDGLIGSSDLVVRGTVVGVSDSFLVEPVNGTEPIFFTDYYMKIEQSYLGTATPSSVSDDGDQIITIRIKGGAGQKVALINESAPDFNINETYLAFLYQIEDGSDYNTAGNHYYLIGDSMGAWLSEEPGVYLDYNNSTVSETELLAAIATPSPINDGSSSSFKTKEEALAEVEADYLAGKMPKEAYDNYMNEAQKEASNFARILSDAEATEYENATIRNARAGVSSITSTE